MNMFNMSGDAFDKLIAMPGIIAERNVRGRGFDFDQDWAAETIHRFWDDLDANVLAFKGEENVPSVGWMKRQVLVYRNGDLVVMYAKED